VAISRLRVLSSARNFHRPLLSLPPLGDVSPVPALVYEREPVKRPHDAPLPALHHAERSLAFSDEGDEEGGVRIILRLIRRVPIAHRSLAVWIKQ
jgi:hypothetical protein|tara:strand:- start:4525 stop:4809 length:285 start_codon:yes stop_codon:yes gene_type:complete